MRRLQRLAVVPGALIFYESPHRIVATLEAVVEVFPQREVAVCRELTKLHEEVLRGPAAQLAEELRARGEVKGEIALVIAPPSEDEEAVSCRLAQRQRIPTRPAQGYPRRVEEGEPASAVAKRLSTSIRAASAMSMPWCSICNRWRISSPCADKLPIPVFTVWRTNPMDQSKPSFFITTPIYGATLIRTWARLIPPSSPRRSGSLSPLRWL